MTTNEQTPGELLQGVARAAVASLLIVLPCLWQREVGIGDFPSHIYNAWLATLIEQGKLPGMALAHQNTNVVVDLALVWLLKHLTVEAAQRIVLGGSALVFFWGVFFLTRAVRGKTPWAIAPMIAIVTYGVIFQLGFSNFYLSSGICCFVIGLLWQRPQRWQVLVAVVLLAVARKAHPFPVGWALGTLAYVWMLQLAERRRLAVLAVSSMAVVFGSLQLTFRFDGEWLRPRLLMVTGAGQAALHGPLYAGVGLLVLIIWAFSYGRQIRTQGWNSWLEQPEVQLYVLALIAGVCMPLTFSVGHNTIGVVTERLSLFAAIYACSLIGAMEVPRRRNWAIAGVSAIFFALLYSDAREFNRYEEKLKAIVAGLPAETRVAALIRFPNTPLQTKAKRLVEGVPGLGIFYDPGFSVNVHHVIDRVCIGHCISYANYEPATYQFQVRALPGTKYALLKGEESGDMQTGSYRAMERDLPLYQIYPCGPQPLDLCGRWLRAGEINGAENFREK
ncbi:MAG: hypothetical protein ACJ71N_10165 [Terriglobales bacterium]